MFHMMINFNCCL